MDPKMPKLFSYSSLGTSSYLHLDSCLPGKKSLSKTPGKIPSRLQGQRSQVETKRKRHRTTLESGIWVRFLSCDQMEELLKSPKDPKQNSSGAFWTVLFVGFFGTSHHFLAWSTLSRCCFRMLSQMERCFPDFMRSRKDWWVARWLSSIMHDVLHCVGYVAGSICVTYSNLTPTLIHWPD